MNGNEYEMPLFVNARKPILQNEGRGKEKEIYFQPIVGIILSHPF